MKPMDRKISRGERGVVLMEVVVALVLFVAAAAILGTALSSSLDSVDRQRRELHASNLALSLLAELQLGARNTEGGGNIIFEPPFEQWTGEVVTKPVSTEGGEASSLTQVEVVIRHKQSATVARMAQVLDLSRPGRPALEGAAASQSGAP